MLIEGQSAPLGPMCVAWVSMFAALVQAADGKRRMNLKSVPMHYRNIIFTDWRYAVSKRRSCRTARTSSAKVSLPMACGKTTSVGRMRKRCADSSGAITPCCGQTGPDPPPKRYRQMDDVLDGLRRVGWRMAE